MPFPASLRNIFSLRMFFPSMEDIEGENRGNLFFMLVLTSTRIDLTFRLTNRTQCRGDVFFFFGAMLPDRLKNVVYLYFVCFVQRKHILFSSETFVKTT